MTDFDVRETVQELESGTVPAWITDHLRRHAESNGADGHYFDASAVGASGLVPNLLLTTVGRRGGRRTTTPLFCGTTANGCVVIGSKGRSDTHPAWHLNLLAHPAADVRVGAGHLAVRARGAGRGARRAAATDGHRPPALHALPGRHAAGDPRSCPAAGAGPWCGIHLAGAGHKLHSASSR